LAISLGGPYVEVRKEKDSLDTEARLQDEMLADCLEVIQWYSSSAFLFFISLYNIVQNLLFNSAFDVTIPSNIESTVENLINNG
jgi:hypothetical protein